MNGIGDYLKRYLGVHTAFERKKNLFIVSVLGVSGVDISKKTIQFKNTSVFVLNLNSNERTVLFLKKKQIIETCLQKGLTITDIK